MVINAPDGCRFSEVIRQSTETNSKTCDNKQCQRKVDVKKYCLHSPKVVVVGFIWETDTPTKLEVKRLVRSCDTHLDVGHLFKSTLSPKEPAVAEIKGVIAYYGRHYISYFKSTKSDAWVLFDDAFVKAVGSNWADVQQCLIEGKFQPLLLFYECPSNTVFNRVAPMAPAMASSPPIRSVPDPRRKSKMSINSQSPLSPLTSKNAGGTSKHDLGMIGKHMVVPLDDIDARFALAERPKSMDAILAKSEIQSANLDKLEATREASLRDFLSSLPLAGTTTTKHTSPPDSSRNHRTDDRFQRGGAGAPAPSTPRYAC